MKKIILVFLPLFILFCRPAQKAVNKDIFRVGYWAVFPAPDILHISSNERRLLANSGANVIQAWLTDNTDEKRPVYDKYAHVYNGCLYRQIEDAWLDYLDSLNTADSQKQLVYIAGYTTHNSKTAKYGGTKQFTYFGRYANEFVSNPKKMIPAFDECLLFYTNKDSGFAWRPGFGGYYVDHETAYSNRNPDYRKGLRYMCERIRARDSSAIIVSSGNIRAVRPDFFPALQGRLDVFESQHYPFRRNTPYKSDSPEYQQVLDKALQEHYIRTRDVIAGYGLTWWAIIQTAKYEERTSRGKVYTARYPSGPELFVQAYLAVACNAKGVLGFTGGSYPGSSTYASTFNGPFTPWMADTLQREKRIIREGNYTYCMADTLALLFCELKAIGPLILKLQAKEIFPASAQKQNIPANSFIKETSGKWIDAATFVRTDSLFAERSYFMLLNRLCNKGHAGEIGLPARAQNIRVFLRHLAPGKAYVVKDVLQKTEFRGTADAAGEFSFEYNLPPGRGRLFEIIREKPQS